MGKRYSSLCVGAGPASQEGLGDVHFHWGMFYKFFVIFFNYYFQDSRMLLGNPAAQNDTDTVLNLPWLSSFYNASREFRYTTVSEWPTTKNISKMQHEKLVVGMAKCQG